MSENLSFLGIYAFVLSWRTVTEGTVLPSVLSISGASRTPLRSCASHLNSAVRKRCTPPCAASNPHSMHGTSLDLDALMAIVILVLSSLPGSQVPGRPLSKYENISVFSHPCPVVILTGSYLTVHGFFVYYCFGPTSPLLSNRHKSYRLFTPPTSLSHCSRYWFLSPSSPSSSYRAST
jgi:hypothetical protein